MIRRTAVAAIALGLAVSGSLAAAEDDAPFAEFTRLDVAAAGGVVSLSGAVNFGGAHVLADDATGDAGVVGMDFSKVSVTQDPGSGELTFTMEIADPTTTPTGMYTVPMTTQGGSMSLFAYANSTQNFVFQVADLNDGYSSNAANGAVDGTTIQWFIPPSALGAAAGSKLNPGGNPICNFHGVSAEITSINGTAAGTCHDDAPLTPFVIGGGVDVTVLGAGGFEEDYRVRVRNNEFELEIDDLSPGTYTVVVETGYGDVEVVEEFTVTV